MNTNLSPRRAAAAVALALTLAACGGDDDSEADAPAVTDAPAGDDTPAATDGDGTDAPAMEPSSITFDAQDSDGTGIVVASVELPSPGFIAVHGDAGGSPGPVIGVSDLLPAGTSTDVPVTLAESLTADSTLFPMVHIDTDGNGIYEFGTVDGVDGPGVTAAGEVAVTGAPVTVTAGDDGTAGDDADGDAGAATGTITIADFAFDGVTEVTVGTTVVVTNTDGARHTWSAADGTFDSGALGQGDSFEFTFTEAGEFEYFCNFHPSMTGTIVVTA